MFRDVKCILCDCDAKVKELVKDGDPPIDCQCSCCGNYYLCPHTSIKIRNNNELRCKLRALLKERKLKGSSEMLTVTDKASNDRNTVTIDELLSQYPKTANDMIDRTLLNFDQLVSHPFSQCSIDGLQMPSITFTENGSDALRMLNTLGDLGYITYTMHTSATGVGSGKQKYGISPPGWKRIEELKNSNIDSKRAFTAMWFNEYTKAIWEDGLYKGIKGAEYTPVKIDNKEHKNKICDEIIAEIRRSKFIVADFTGNRGGVYYEAGFAKGLGIPVIWTIEEAWLTKNKEKLHFDTRQYNHIMYEDPADLRDRLKNRILATIV